MKKQHIVWVVFVLLTTSIYGQSVQNDSTEIAIAVDRLYKAMVDKDEKNLERLTAEKLSYGHSGGTIENKAQYLEAVLNGSFDFVSITPENQYIDIAGDTGLVRHIFVAEGIDGENPVDVRIGAMLIYQKQEKEWKLLARQAYKL